MESFDEGNQGFGGDPTNPTDPPAPSEQPVESGGSAPEVDPAEPIIGPGFAPPEGVQPESKGEPVEGVQPTEIDDVPEPLR